jgi:hypothetical protein
MLEVAGLRERLSFSEADVVRACLVAYYTAYGRLEKAGKDGLRVEVFMEAFVRRLRLKRP